jgi:hypothetical protein
MNHVGLQSSPNGIEASEPAEQFSVLNPRNGTRQTLRHVVVGVDHARNDHMVFGVDHTVSSARQGVRRTYDLDAIIANINGGVA